MIVPKLGIIILNWNGWKDTCECLASLLTSTFQDFQVILIENGSTDDSVEKITSWARGEMSISVGPLEQKPSPSAITFQTCSLEEIENSSARFDADNPFKMLMIRSPENLGFARGCNVGLRYALQSGFEYVCLLNNDTTVEPDALACLYDFMERQSKVDVITPIIYYYHRPDTVWNFGGRLTFTGRRRYFLGNRKMVNRHIEPVRNVTFLTGCALFARSRVFGTYGLLSESFFFGEEDYEFSLRMKENRVHMAALSCARVYHKVNASNDRTDPSGRLSHAFVGYLNRFIDRKKHSRRWAWQMWRFLCLAYILPLVAVRHGLSFRRLYRFGRNLWAYSSDLDGVSQQDYFHIKELFRTGCMA